MVKVGIEEIAFDVGRAQLASQKEDLRNVRNQAPFGAAINGLIATVFATLAPEDISLIFRTDPIFLWFGIEGWFVFLTFGLSLVFSILVLVSWGECCFEFDVNWILTQSSMGIPDEEIFSQLSKDADIFFDRNEDVIGQARMYLWFSLVLAFFQIPAWALAIF